MTSFYGAKPYSTLSWIPCYRLLNHWEGEINDINVGEALLKEGLFLNRNQKSVRYANKTFKVEVVPLLLFPRDLNFSHTVNIVLRISLLYLRKLCISPHILNYPNMVLHFLVVPMLSYKICTIIGINKYCKALILKMLFLQESSIIRMNIIYE